MGSGCHLCSGSAGTVPRISACAPLYGLCICARYRLDRRHRLGDNVSLKIFFACLLLVCLPGCGIGLCADSGSCTGTGTALLTFSLNEIDFGSRTFGTQTDQTILVSNTGSGVASEFSSTTVSAPFLFKGGAFPGTGGTCSDLVAPGASCTLILSFNSIGPVNSSEDSVTFRYWTGSAYESQTFRLKGSADNGKLIAIKGFSEDVQAVVPTADAVYYGGYFTAVNDFTSSRIAKTDTKDKFDRDFSARTGTGFDGNVLKLAVPTSPAGTVYVYGGFTAFDGTSVNRLARLTSAGTLDTSFVSGTGTSGTPTNMAMSKSGDLLYIWGTMTGYNGTSQNHILRILPSGALDTTFVTGTGFSPSNPDAVFPRADGTLLVSGFFTSYRGTACNKLVRLLADGTLDTGFDVGAGFDSGPNRIAELPDGKILVSGSFTSYRGTTQRQVARLNPDLSLDATLSTGTGFFLGPNTLIPIEDGSGDFYVGGIISTYNGSPARYIMRLNADGSVDTAFDCPASGNLWSVALARDGTGDLYLGTNSFSFGGKAIQNYARILPSGELSPNLELGTRLQSRSNFVVPSVLDIGDFYITGNLYNGTNLPGIARLNADGTVDTSFVAGAISGGSVSSLVEAPSARKVYIGGGFTSYGGTAVGGFTRANSDGSLDTSYPTAGFNNQVFSLRLEPSTERLYAVGNFTNYNGTARSQIVRLSTDGTIDTSFDVGAGLTGGLPQSAALDSQGRLYAVGTFSNYKGTAAGRIVRILSDGTYDTTFQTGAGFNGTATMVCFTADGSDKLYVTGSFTSYAGATANQMVRLNSDGSHDTSFSTGTGFNAAPGCVVSPGFSGVLANGTFTTYQGSPAPYLVRLNDDGSVNTDFTLEATNWVTAGAASVDGTSDIYLTGDFMVLNGTIQGRVGRITPMGEVD